MNNPYVYKSVLQHICTRIIFLQLLFLATSYAGQLCLSCQNLPHPWDCNKLEECGPSERCFVESFVTSIGSTIFNSGCKSTFRCVTKRSVNEAGGDLGQEDGIVKREDVPICDKCCDGDYCNRELCDFSTPSIPFANMTACLSCDDVLSPKDCQYLTYCSRDDVCYTEKININGEDRYRLGCVRRDACRDEQANSPAVIGKRQTADDSPDPNAYCAKCCRTSGTGSCNRELCGPTRPVFKQQDLYTPPYRRDCNDIDVSTCAMWNAMDYQVCARNTSIYNYACREYCKTCVNPGHVMAPSGFLWPASDCFYDSKRYEGKYETTITNKKCIRWSSVIAEGDDIAQNLPDASIYISGSKCRDPLARGHPWCFTSAQREWEYCPVPYCQQCYFRGNSQAFDGQVSEDYFGYTCDSWGLNNAPDSLFPRGNKSLSENYCRDPYGFNYTYCYENSELTRCAVPECTVDCQDDQQTDCVLIKDIACNFEYISLTLCPKTCKACSTGLLPAIPIAPPKDNCTDNVKANCPILKDYICNDPVGALQYCPKTCSLCDSTTSQTTAQVTSPTTPQVTGTTVTVPITLTTSPPAPPEWNAWTSWSCQRIKGACLEVRSRNCSQSFINSNGTLDPVNKCGTNYYNIQPCTQTSCPEFFTTTRAPPTKPPCEDDPNIDCDNLELLNLLCELPATAIMCQRSCGICPDQVCTDNIDCSSSSIKQMFCGNITSARTYCRKSCHACDHDPLPLPVNSCGDPLSSDNICKLLNSELCICNDPDIRTLCKNYCDDKCSFATVAPGNSCPNDNLQIVGKRHIKRIIQLMNSV